MTLDIVLDNGHDIGHCTGQWTWTLYWTMDMTLDLDNKHCATTTSVHSAKYKQTHYEILSI